MALAITPPGEFGDLRTLQGFKPRFETALRLGPVRIAGKCSQTRRRLTNTILSCRGSRVLENNSFDINVQLNIETLQSGELTHTKISEPGKFTQIGNSIYLRFNESLENNDKASILVKITEKGEIHVKRVAKSTNLASLLYFTHQEHNTGHLETEYGVLTLDTYTKDSKVQIVSNPLSGKINIDYDLIYDNNVIGNYKFRLIFGA